VRELLAIVVGGAAGAVGRFWVANGVYALLGRAFPWGTLMVNAVGSLVMGFLYVVLIERGPLSAELRALLLVGFLGAFTTFSSFSIETLVLIEQGYLARAFANIWVSVLVCLAACWFGLVLGRTL
jgi:CrcB protein